MILYIFRLKCQIQATSQLFLLGLSDSTDVAMIEESDVGETLPESELGQTLPEEDVNQRPGFTSENFKIELQGIPKFFGAAQVQFFLPGIETSRKFIHRALFT